MAQGWKQVWIDIINSLRSDPYQEDNVADISSVEYDTEQAQSDSEISESARLDIEPQSSENEDIEKIISLVTVSQQAVEGDALVKLEEQLCAQPLNETTDEPTSAELINWRTLLPIIAVFTLFILWFIVSDGASHPQPPAPNVIASFEGGQITTEDVETHLELLTPNEIEGVIHSVDTLLLVIEDMVMDQLALRWASTRQPEQDTDFQHTMEHITEELNLETLDVQLHEDDIPVSESEIQDYYYSNRTQFGEEPLSAVREQIRTILVSDREDDYIQTYIQQLRDESAVTRNFELLDVPTPSEDDLRVYYESNRNEFVLPPLAFVTELKFPIGNDAQTARQNADDALLSIRSGADFEAVGSDDPLANLSVNATITEGTRESEWDTVVFGLGIGEVSEVFQVGEVFYIVRLDALEPSRTQTFEEVRDIIAISVTSFQTDEWFTVNSNRSLFTLEGRQYTVGQFYQEYQELSPLVQAEFAGSQRMRDLAEHLIDRLLLLEDTNEQLMDLENQPLTDEARLQVIKQMMHQEEVDDAIRVSDEEITQFYNDNIELMNRPAQSRIRYIRIGLGASEDEARRARERADEAYSRLVPGIGQSGEDFATIAQEYSEDVETASNGGEFPDWIGESPDIFTEIELHAFHERILTLQLNEISQVFQFGDSLYIVQIIEQSEPEILSLEQVRSSIEEILSQQEHENLTQQLEKTLLEQADFIAYPSVLQSYLSQNSTR